MRIFLQKCLIFVFTLISVGVNHALADSTNSPSDSAQPSQSANVQMSVKVEDFVRLVEKHHEAEFIMELRQSWQDDDFEADRIPESREEVTLKKPKLPKPVMIEQDKLAWVPAGIQVLRSRKEEVISDQFIVIPGRGLVTRSQRVKVTVGCKMHYSLFPFDLHVCSLILSGIDYKDSPPSNWTQGTSSVCGELEAYQFHVRGYASQVTKEGQLLVHTIVTRTSALQLFSQLYNPVILLCILSYFTMSFGSFGYRIATSLTCLVTMIVITSIFWTMVPRTHHPTAVEHYFAISLGLTFQVVFTNLLMYAYLSKAPVAASPKKNTDLETGNDSAGNNNKPSLNCGSSVQEEHIMKMGKFHQLMYFKGLKPAKKHIPIFFIIANIIYWPIILYFSSGLPKGFQYVKHECS